MKKVLMIAYAFPPINTSGSARPQYFAKYLSEFNFWPIVLTREGSGGKKSDIDSLKTIKGVCEIVRAKPWDNDDWDAWVRRRFGWLNFVSIIFRKNKFWLTDMIGWRLGFYFREYIHWILPGVFNGLKIIRNRKVDIIWATGPRWDSLRLGYWLSRLSRKPLVLDIRDPWTYGVLWDPQKKVACKRETTWEKKILNHSEKIIFTSPITAKIYKARYENKLNDKIETVTNGFAESQVKSLRTISDDKCLFTYLGKLDKEFRNPNILFDALKFIANDKDISEHIRFEFYTDADWIDLEIERHGIQSIAVNCGFVSQTESLQRMAGSDYLILLQTVDGYGCDVISGKLFEYLSANKPIFGIIPPDGGDAWLLDTLGVTYITYGTNPELIATRIKNLFFKWKSDNNDQLCHKSINQYSRHSLTGELANIFNSILNKVQRNGIPAIKR